MSNDSVSRTMLVALALCVACSVLVSSAVVLLRPKQEENRRMEELKNILVASGLYTTDSEVTEIFKDRIRRVTIRLADGGEAEGEIQKAGLDPEQYSIKEALRKSASSEEIGASDDLAGLKRRPRWINVYLIREGETMRGVVLPVFGKGLWSTMYGFISLEADLRTIRGFSFYEHGETPGLGGEVDNPAWKGQWPGKQLSDETGSYRLKVIKGRADDLRPEQKLHTVDGLSGATLTTRGIDNLLRYWMGDKGYGPFFQRMRRGEFNE